MNELERRRINSILSRSIPRTFHDLSNPLMICVFMICPIHFTKNGFIDVLKIIGPYLQEKQRRCSNIPECTQLLMAIHIIATNSFLQTTGDLFHLSKSSVSRSLSAVSDAFSEHVDLFVNWPTNEEIRVIAERVHTKYGLPDVFGAIDGSHFRIMAPPENEYLFVNRYHIIDQLNYEICM